MTIAGLLAASVIVLPALDDSTAMRRIMELYPQEAASSGVSGAVDVEYVVTPEGRVQECTVRQVSGYSGFGAVVCHAINLVVGADGHLQQCQAVSSQAPSTLTQVACGMVAGWNRMVEDGAGQPAPHVTRLHVRFREEEPAVSD